VPSAWLGWFQNNGQMIQRISGCIKPDREKKCPEGNELHSLQPNKHRGTTRVGLSCSKALNIHYLCLVIEFYFALQ
jgi:hypothetical protein